MSVRRRQNWLGQQRVDVPHLRSIESAVSNDFDELISGLVIGENKSYVVRGFEINMPGAIGSSANGLQLIVENTSILHGASNESGTFYNIPAGTPSEILSSTTNDRVEGAFTPSTDNYIGIEFVREVDDATVDQVYFWNPTTNVEITKTVPLALILDYKIVISTSTFASNVLPVAIVQTDGSNNVISITDRRPLLLRLGTAGDSDPNPFYVYPWSDGRVENFYTSTSSNSSPFQGGDKQIKNLKDFFDALMTEIKILKGTPYWYSENTGGSIVNLRADLANTAFTGKGNVVHGRIDFQGQVAGMTSNVVIRTVNVGEVDNITLTANGSDIATLISDYNAANPDAQIELISGNDVQIPTSDIVLTSKPGQVNWSQDIFLRLISSRLSYKILANDTSTEASLGDNQVAYINLVRGENITPPLVFTNGGTVVTSVGNVSWTDDVEPGDFIKDASRGDEFYYEIATVDELYQVTLTTPFQEPDSGPAGFDAQYAWGTYETNPLPSTPRHIFIDDRENVPFDEDAFWLFFRSDDGGAIPRVYARVLGGTELEQGESRTISDNTAQAVLDYIGSASESDATPNYLNATGSAITNIHLIDNENLTLGMKRLEHRDDVIPRVRVIDIISTSLPTGASVTLDQETLLNGDYVFFTNPAIEGLYKVSGVGTSVAFEKINAFKGEQDPVDGDLIRVESGTIYFQTVWKRVANEWKPLEVKEATKEPTGFPNRVDSVMSFDDGLTTFTIEPVSTHFDIFIKGKPYRFTTPQSIQVNPISEGIYFFYFEDGVLTFDTTFDLTLITENAWCATVYWDSGNLRNILLGDERHGITMDSATHEYLHNLNGTVLTNGGDIGFTPYEEPAAAQFDGQVAGMTTDVIIDADNTGLAGNVTLNPVADSAATATLSLTTDIILTSVALGSARNTETFTLEVDPAAANPTDTILVDFTGTSVSITCTVTPNDGTFNGGLPVDLTTAELAELINTGDVAAKTGQITLTDGGGLRTLQTATGGDATNLADGGEGDSVIGTFAGGTDASDIDQLILDWNTANPTNTLTLTAGDGSQIPTADIVLAGGIDGAGDTDDDAQISLNNMTLRDEDIVMNIEHDAAPSQIFQQILDPIAEIPVYYRNGASGDWRRDVANTFPVKQGATRIQYNNPAGPWTQEDIQEGYYVSMWIYATNNQDEPVIAILGQAEHDSLSTAQELDTPQSLSFGALPSVEFKLLYRCIFQSSSAFANAPSAALVDVRDLRAVEDTQFAQVAPNDHGSLSGLSDPDHPASAINMSGVEKNGGLSEFDDSVGEALTTLNRLLGQLRIKPHPVNGDRVIITGANRILNSGTTLIQEIKNLVLNFEGAEIDFVTGQIFKADGFTSLGIDFTPVVIPASEYVNYSVTLIPSEVNVDNTITAQLIVLPGEATNAVKADAPKAPFAQGTKLGQVTVQESGGGIAAIDESAISQLGTGGGGSGGTGDANELLERLKNRLANYGAYEYMTPVIFSSVEEELTDELSTTAEYSVVNTNYEFSFLTNNQFVSAQLLDNQFLSEEIELDEIELIHYWNLEAVDTAATYEVSRDGGNEWQTVSMSRIGSSDAYRGTHTFTEEAVNTFSQTENAFNGTYTDLTDLNELSEQFILVNTTTIKKITTGIFKTGAATGYVYAVAVKDNGGGLPSTDPLDEIGRSRFVSIDGLAAGAQNVDFEIRFTNTPETYHVVFKTDVIYKTEYTNSAGANKIGIEDDGADIAYTIEGFEPDLRVKITSGTDEVVSEGFGIFYKDDNKISFVDGNVLRNATTFVGDVDNLDTFTLTFLPDPRLIHVYELGTGQVYRYGAFVIQGYDIIFEPNTFNKPETVTLEFLQIQGGSFDNSDRNGSLLAANFLGSTDGNIDLSVAGRGFHLRSPDGTLYEIVVKDGGIGFDFYEVT